MSKSLPAVGRREGFITQDQKAHDIRRLRSNLNTKIATLEQYRKSLVHECATEERRINKEGIAVSL